MNYIWILIFLFSFITAQETVGILPVTIIKKEDFTKYKNLSLQIYNELKNAIFKSYVFSLVPPKKIFSSLKDLKIKNLTDSNTKLFLIGKYSGSSKLLYSEIYPLKKNIFLYIKVADSQKKEILTNFKFLLKKDDTIQKLIKKVLKQINDSYIPPKKYNEILTELKLNNKIFEQIIFLGGSLEAYYIIHKKNKISTSEYINVLLFGGSAYEYSIFKQFGFSKNYYITYIGNEFGIRKN